MTAAAFKPRLVPPPLDDSQLLSELLEKRRAELDQRADTDSAISAVCRRWSDANGFPVVLRPEQILRAMEAGR